MNDFWLCYLRLLKTYEKWWLIKPQQEKKDPSYQKLYFGYTSEKGTE